VEFIQSLFGGNALALIGAFIAIGLAGIGSAKGVGLVGLTSAGAVEENPSIASKCTLLQLLPATQGLYGFVLAFLILVKMEALSGNANLTIASGAYFLCAALPIGVVGLVSAIHQAKVAASGVILISKRNDQFGRSMMSASLVELYAILSLLVSALLVLSYTPTMVA